MLAATPLGGAAMKLRRHVSCHAQSPCVVSRGPPRGGGSQQCVAMWAAVGRARPGPMPGPCDPHWPPPPASVMRAIHNASGLDGNHRWKSAVLLVLSDAAGLHQLSNLHCSLSYFRIKWACAALDAQVVAWARAAAVPVFRIDRWSRMQPPASSAWKIASADVRFGCAKLGLSRELLRLGFEPLTLDADLALTRSPLPDLAALLAHGASAVLARNLFSYRLGRSAWAQTQFARPVWRTFELNLACHEFSLGRLAAEEEVRWTQPPQQMGFANIGLMFFRVGAPAAVQLLNSAMELLFSQDWSRVQGDQAAIHRVLCDVRHAPVGLALSLAPLTLIAPSPSSLGWDDATLRAHLMPSWWRRPPPISPHIHPRFCAAFGGVSPAVQHAFFNLPAHSHPKELVLHEQAWFLASADELTRRRSAGMPRMQQQLPPPPCRTVPRIATCPAEEKGASSSDAPSHDRLAVEADAQSDANEICIAKSTARKRSMGLSFGEEDLHGIVARLFAEGLVPRGTVLDGVANVPACRRTSTEAHLCTHRTGGSGRSIHACGSSVEGTAVRVHAAGRRRGLLLCNHRAAPACHRRRADAAEHRRTEFAGRSNTAPQSGQWRLGALQRHGLLPRPPPACARRDYFADALCQQHVRSALWRGWWRAATCTPLPRPQH
jgi:hypothetical protein